MEAIWKASFTKRSPETQRRSAYFIQFVRVVVIALVLRVLWSIHFDTVESMEYWFSCTILLFAIFGSGCVPMSACLHIEGKSWQERLPDYARHVHCLPYDVRWYLRRTTLSNAFVLTILARSSVMPEHLLFDGQFPIVLILFPTMAFWLFLTIIRKKFDLFEPPPMGGAILHRTSDKPPAPNPGQPNPFDVEEYLHSLPPRRD